MSFMLKEEKNDSQPGLSCFTSSYESSGMCTQESLDMFQVLMAKLDNTYKQISDFTKAKTQYEARTIQLLTINQAMSSENLILKKKMQELQAFFKSIDRKKSKTTFTEQYTQKNAKVNKENYETSEDKEDGSTTTATESLCNSLKVSLNINPQKKKNFKFYQVALIRSMPVVNL